MMPSHTSKGKRGWIDFKTKIAQEKINLNSPRVETKDQPP